MPTRRQGIRRAHSATHILHYALQKHLGKHAQQQGSKVDNDWLRFDFANPVGRRAKSWRRSKTKSTRGSSAASRSAGRHMPLAEARKTGAMMLFGEKYPDVVRMVSMGEFSKELCGGTHLDNTRPSRAVADHRRGERRGRHAADHRPDRPGGPGARPPERSGPGRTAAACCGLRRRSARAASRPWSRKSASSRSSWPPGPRGGRQRRATAGRRRATSAA